MKRILLTGSNGFLGKIIFETINNDKNIVFGLSRSRSAYNFSLEKAVPDFMDQFDLVIHTAGKAHILPKTNIEKQEFYDINVNGTINLLKGLEINVLPKQFVFISSVAVYGIETGLNINEDYSLLANDPYGLSKIQAEKIILDWCKKHNVICTILRLPLIVGANPPGNLGAMITGIKKGYYINIAGGKTQKSMVLASDVAKFILKVSEIGGIYNLTDGYNASFSELSITISLQIGGKFVPNIPLVFAKVLAKIGDVVGAKFPINSNKLAKILSPLTFDDSKARKAFGWNPTPVLKGFKLEENV